MLPVFILIGTHVEVAAIHFAEEYIAGTHNKVSLRKAHGRGAIAATSALVKHQGTVNAAKSINDFGSVFGEGNSGKWHYLKWLKWNLLDKTGVNRERNLSFAKEG